MTMTRNEQVWMTDACNEKRADKSSLAGGDHVYDVYLCWFVDCNIFVSLGCTWLQDDDGSVATYCQ